MLKFIYQTDETLRQNNLLEHITLLCSKNDYLVN